MCSLGIRSGNYIPSVRLHKASTLAGLDGGSDTKSPINSNRPSAMHGNFPPSISIAFLLGATVVIVQTLIGRSLADGPNGLGGLGEAQGFAAGRGQECAEGHAHDDCPSVSFPESPFRGLCMESWFSWAFVGCSIRLTGN